MKYKKGDIVELKPKGTIAHPLIGKKAVVVGTFKGDIAVRFYCETYGEFADSEDGLDHHSYPARRLKLAKLTKLEEILK
jgi:hypothetical protein